MSSYQNYSQGLVPAIQQMQMAAPIQVGVTNQPNAGQSAYLQSLQNQIKQTQQNEAANMQGYQTSLGQIAQANAAKAQGSGGGGFWSFLGKVAPLALAAI